MIATVSRQASGGAGKVPGVPLGRGGRLQPDLQPGRCDPRLRRGDDQGDAVHVNVKHHQHHETSKGRDEKGKKEEKKEGEEEEEKGFRLGPSDFLTSLKEGDKTFSGDN